VCESESRDLSVVPSLTIVCSMPAAALLTDRLRLEPWGPAHAGLVVSLTSMPEVMRFIGDGNVWSVTRARQLAVANGDHWRRHDFGWRAAVDRRTDQPIGVAALNFAGEGSGVDPDEYEIGWWRQPSAWRKGLAREAALAVRDEAYGRVGAPSVIARIQPANAASLRVAESIGLAPESHSTGRGGEPIVVLRGRPTRS
jgi:RimJ/RimL family protein N-acetyltransferase